MRGGNHRSLPSKIYFVHSGEVYYGPYTSRPTLVFKEVGGELVILVRNKEGNYIKEEDK